MILTWTQKAATKNAFPKTLQAQKQCEAWHLVDAANVYAKDGAQ